MWHGDSPSQRWWHRWRGGVGPGFGDKILSGVRSGRRWWRGLLCAVLAFPPHTVASNHFENTPCAGTADFSLFFFPSELSTLPSFFPSMLSIFSSFFPSKLSTQIASSEADVGKVGGLDPLQVSGGGGALSLHRTFSRTPQKIQYSSVPICPTTSL